MKDLSFLSYFLGLKLTTNSTGLHLLQTKYASNLIAKAGLTDSKIAHSPLKQNVRLSLSHGTLLIDLMLYQTFVGSLVYLTVTR